MENNQQKNKKLNLFLIILSSILIIFFTVFCFYNIFYFSSCYKSVKKMSKNTYEEYMRIKIYGSTYTSEENTISGSFSILNKNGNEIAVIERSWNGSYLAVDFVKLSMMNKTYLFPIKIYGKDKIIDNSISGKKKYKQKRKGSSLEKYYIENKQCLLLGDDSSFQEKFDLYKIARFATKKCMLFDNKYKKIITVDLSNCKVDNYYSIILNQRNQLVVIAL